MLCPNCFHDKPEQEKLCSVCQFEETVSRDPRLLPYRYQLKKGRFTLGRLLGKPGGFGVAYKAFDNEQGVVVVIKECLLTESHQVERVAGDPKVLVNTEFEPQYRKWLARFRSEAVLISQFNNPNIVQVTEIFDENNTAYFVMPFVQAEDLSKHCAQRGGFLAEPEVRQLAIDLFTALADVHRHGVVHRDIKPTNILITQAKKRPMLIDFGSAREHFDEEQSVSHMAIHSPKYAPIEQVMGMTNQGPWTDVYSVCATLYFCLTGAPPAKSGDRYRPFDKQPDPYVSIREQMPALEDDLAEVIDKGLAVLPKHRIRTAAQALSMLGVPIEAGQVLREEDQADDQSTQWSRSNDDATQTKTAALQGLNASASDMTTTTFTRQVASDVNENSSDVPQQTPLAPTSVSQMKWFVAFKPMTKALIATVVLLVLLLLISSGVLPLQISGRYIADYLPDWLGLVFALVIAVLVSQVMKKDQSPADQKRVEPVAVVPVPEIDHGQTKTITVFSAADKGSRNFGIEIRLQGPNMATVSQVMTANEVLIIGRNPKLVDICITNPLLSGQHVRLSMNDQQEFVLQDLQSTNHTYEFQSSSREWQTVQQHSGRKGTFMLGSTRLGGVLLTLRQVVL